MESTSYFPIDRLPPELALNIATINFRPSLQSTIDTVQGMLRLTSITRETTQWRSDTAFIITLRDIFSRSAFLSTVSNEQEIGYFKKNMRFFHFLNKSQKMSPTPFFEQTGIYNTDSWDYSIDDEDNLSFKKPSTKTSQEECPLLDNSKDDHLILNMQDNQILIPKKPLIPKLSDDQIHSKDNVILTLHDQGNNEITTLISSPTSIEEITIPLLPENMSEDVPSYTPQVKKDTTALCVVQKFFHIINVAPFRVDIIPYEGKQRTITMSGLSYPQVLLCDNYIIISGISKDSPTADTTSRHTSTLYIPTLFIFDKNTFSVHRIDLTEYANTVLSTKFSLFNTITYKNSLYTLLPSSKSTYHCVKIDCDNMIYTRLEKPIPTLNTHKPLISRINHIFFFFLFPNSIENKKNIIDLYTLNIETLESNEQPIQLKGLFKNLLIKSPYKCTLASGKNKLLIILNAKHHVYTASLGAPLQSKKNAIFENFRINSIESLSSILSKLHITK